MAKRESVSLLGWLLRAVLLVVVASGLWVGGKLGLVYVDKWNVDRFTQFVAEQAVHPMNYRHVDRIIRTKIRKHNFPFSPEQVILERRLGGEVRVTVEWEERVDFTPIFLRDLLGRQERVFHFRSVGIAHDPRAS